MHINGPKDLGLLIRSRRQERNWTQGDLARHVGSTQRWVSEVENGKTSAEIGMVLQTLSLLGVELHADKPAPRQAPPATVHAGADDLDDIADMGGPRP